MTSRSTFLATALAFAALAPAASAATERTIAAGPDAAVIKTAKGTLVAQSAVTGKRTVLGALVPTPLVDVDGNYVGFVRRLNDRVEVRSLDARSGKVRYRAEAENVQSLEVRRTGTVVWVSDHGAEDAVHIRNAVGTDTLGVGKAIDPFSLAIASSKATTAHVYWTDGDVAHSVPVE